VASEEVSFGSTGEDGTGVFFCAPKHAPNAEYDQSIDYGLTTLNRCLLQLLAARRAICQGSFDAVGKSTTLCVPWRRSTAATLITCSTGTGLAAPRHCGVIVVDAAHLIAQHAADSYCCRCGRNCNHFCDDLLRLLARPPNPRSRLIASCSSPHPAGTRFK
jgi:hypothetical protein